MKTVAFVPIKMNNERLPGKNTKKFSNGRPLISYILSTLKTVDELGKQSRARRAWNPTILKPVECMFSQRI